MDISQIVGIIIYKQYRPCPTLLNQQRFLTVFYKVSVEYTDLASPHVSLCYIYLVIDLGLDIYIPAVREACIQADRHTDRQTVI